MMPQEPVHREGDRNTAGGAARVGAPSVLVNGLPIVIDGTGVTPHMPFFPPHLSTVTSNGLTNVIAEYIPINVRGNMDQCGHPRADGSPNVVAG